MDENYQKEFFSGQKPYIYVSDYFINDATSTHSHTFYEFVYVERGSAVHRMNDQIFVLFPGTFFTMRPEDKHEYFNVHDIKIFNCLFYPEVIKNHWNELSCLPGISEILYEKPIWSLSNILLSGIDRLEFKSLMTKMSDECKNRHVGWELKVQLHLIELLVMVSRSLKPLVTRENIPNYAHLKSITDFLIYIEKNLDQPLSIQEIAHTFNFNVDYFSRMFKKHIGMTPTEYIRMVKIGKALEILLMKDISITEAARQVGYFDLNYFSRVFHAQVGKTPSEIKLRFKNNE